MIKTLSSEPVNFWYFNNGITAITDSIDPFHDDSTKVTITGIQIINGAQTVFREGINRTRLRRCP